MALPFLWRILRLASLKERLISEEAIILIQAEAEAKLLLVDVRLA